MKFIETDKSTSHPVKIYYEDLGRGKNVVLIHGWPLNHEMWEYQMAELPKHNIRCIAYDRRGFGLSDKPWSGYDYDTLAADLNTLLNTLDLEKVTLVGFSMGAGEVVRYATNHGTERIAKVVLISPVTPFLLKTNNNPDGVDRSVFDDMLIDISSDRPAFLSAMAKKFFGSGFLNKPVSDEILHWYQFLGLTAGAKATRDCLHSFSETDFRSDMKNLDVPVLIIQGDMDKTIPLEKSGKRTADMIRHADLKIYHNAPHGLFFTDKIRLNRDLVNYINGIPVSKDDDEDWDNTMDLSQPFNL
jgi:non-heme chloroperoxidase